MTLIEILSLVSRGDLKQELLKEINRQIDVLEPLTSKAELNTTRLLEILSSHKSVFERLHKLRGQLGSHLKTNDFINSIRQRTAILGGICNFDLPEYQHWLEQPYEQRNKMLVEWVAPFEVVKEGIAHTLQLIRESSTYINTHAQKGFYNQNLDPSQPNQLIRINIEKYSKLFPECSSGNHRFSIRFLEQANPDSTPKKTQKNIEFKLACCTF